MQLRPASASTSLFQIVGEDPTHDLLGPIATFASGVEMAFCSIFYYRTLVVPRKGKGTGLTSTVQVTTTMTSSQFTKTVGAQSRSLPNTPASVSRVRLDMPSIRA